MKRFVITLAFTLMLPMQLCVAQVMWERVGQRPMEQYNRPVAVDSMTCFLTYGPYFHTFPGYPLRVTRDAGASWQTACDSTVSIDADDAGLLTALAAHTVDGTPHLRVQQSIDTGLTWNAMATIPLSALPNRVLHDHISVLSYDADHAALYSAGYFMTIARGDTVPVTVELPIIGVSCVRTGRVFWTWSAQRVMRSTNDGQDWMTVLEAADIGAFAARDSLTAWAYTLDYRIVSTADGGASWQDLPAPRILQYRSEVVSSLYAPAHTAHGLWLKTRGEYYARNADGTWDALDTIPGSGGLYQDIDRCRDGCSWTTGFDTDHTDDQGIYRATAEPRIRQMVRVLDRSSSGVKRGVVVLPHIGWQSWSEATVERAVGSGEFEKIGSLRSPDYVFTDESCPSEGPFRYRVTFDPPAGQYDRLEASAILLNRDSVLILDLLEYFTTPDNRALVYDNGMTVRCSYDPVRQRLTFHRKFADRDTTDAFIEVAQHPDLLLREDWLTFHYRFLNTAGGRVNTWPLAVGQRFIVTDSPPGLPPDTLTLRSSFSNGPEDVTAMIILVRNVGIALMDFSYYVSMTQTSGRHHISLDHVLSASDEPRNPSDIYLAPLYPNPATGLTQVRLDVPHNAHAAVLVFDALGRQVDSIFDGTAAPGTRYFQYDASALPRGMYFIVLKQDHAAQSRKLLHW